LTYPNARSAYANAFEFKSRDFDAGKFYPPSNFPQSDLGRRADSRWALPQISSYDMQRVCTYLQSFLHYMSQ